MVWLYSHGLEVRLVVLACNRYWSCKFVAIFLSAKFRSETLAGVRSMPQPSADFMRLADWVGGVRTAMAIAADVARASS